MVDQAYNSLAATTRVFESATQACGGKLTCVTAQDRVEATALDGFAASVRSAGLVGQPAADATALANDASGAGTSLDQLATATTAAQYESDFASSTLQQQFNSLDSDYQKLVHDLGG